MNPKRAEAFKRAAGGPFAGALLRAVLSAILLSLICNWHALYEEDQMAKTAQITALAVHSNWRHFSTVTDYYSKDLFSAYYMVATAFYKLSGLPPLEALNCFSVLCGIIFLTVTPAFLSRVFKLPPWLSWLVLVNVPIVLISFTYGNEAALAITAMALAAFALSFENVAGRIIGALFYVLAAYSRSDYLFLWPLLALLTLVRRDGKLDRRQSLKNVLSFAAASAIPGVLYLVVVLRTFPKPEFFDSQTTLKLFVAYFLYSPGLMIAIFAAVGFVLCIARRETKYLCLLIGGVQLLPYITHLDSPKYILPIAVIMGIFAMAGMRPLLRRAPWLLAILLAWPWFISVSPYGIFGPQRSVFWYVPTSDGPLPTGGFLTFFERVKTGFYQRRYDQELAQIEEVMPVIEGKPGAQLLGYFNGQTLRLWEARHQRWELPAQDLPFWVHELDTHGAANGQFLIQMSYLYPLKQSPTLREKLAAAYRDGRVRAEGATARDPFPNVIEVGSQLAKDTDKDLGKRILFANAYYQNNQEVRRDVWLKDFQGVSWIPRERFVKEGREAAKALYMDNEWVCLAEDVPGAHYYSMRFPPIYSRSRKPLN